MIKVDFLINILRFHLQIHRKVWVYQNNFILYFFSLKQCLYRFPRLFWPKTFLPLKRGKPRLKKKHPSAQFCFLLYSLPLVKSLSRFNRVRWIWVNNRHLLWSIHIFNSSCSSSADARNTQLILTTYYKRNAFHYPTTWFIF